ncbi:TA system VapC family ribonuclease toxin [Agromyces sp. NPDC049794]|uniref:TA system VapC family ribonuclease toxin n=1 Tax=unclassified Agromyces TaxID=2639701 RepID=UPI0033D82035
MTERPDVQLLDVNVLVALVSPQHVHHAAAHRWFAGVSDWATTPITETAFIRLISNPVVVGADLTPQEVIALLRRLCKWRGHRFLRDETRLLDPSIDLAALVGPRQVTDFHLVQLAKIAGATLATFDAKLIAALAVADRRHVHLIEV